jgi:5-formyltetrahydrofolate cyclo-ligase
MVEPNEDNTAWRRALRREMVARRAALSDAEHAGLSARIVAHLLAALPRPVCRLLLADQARAGRAGGAERWAALGARAALPVVVAEDAPLAFRLWTPETPLAPDRYGIPTPTAGDWLQPDLILLPLNGFDAAGYRLGYGGGYFDRTLAALSPRPLAVGVGFEINRWTASGRKAHDQRLDWIVTEAGANGVWHLGGVIVNTVGGGCTAPSAGSASPEWQKRLNEVSARSWSEGPMSGRLRLRVIHPMDTGLVAGIPAFHLESLMLKDDAGTPLMRLTLSQPVSENPVFTLHRARSAGSVEVSGRDNNGNTFDVRVAQ